MRAELALFGMRFNMSRRARRRALVALIYAAFTALMAASWFLDHWRAPQTSSVSPGGQGAETPALVKIQTGD